MTTSSDTQVLIGGAGPTGLTLACDLSRRGIHCRIIDKSSGPSIHSKALGVQARTLELLERLDVAEAICRDGRKLEGGNLYSRGKRFVRFQFAGIDTPYQSIVSFPQSVTEQLLIDRLSALGVEVEWNLGLESAHQQSARVTATLRHERDGRYEEVSGDWLVGCDGAHSTVRHTLKSPFEGGRFEESFYLADLKADLQLDQNELYIFLSHHGPFLFLPLPQDNYYRVIVSEPPGKTDVDREPTVEKFQRWLEERITMPKGLPIPQLSDPIWLSHFRVHRRLVPKYRHSRIFLAGDAAHIHSPVGGQGMNTSIQDAFNLAWKLALVIQGKAPDSLLDSYHAERRPVAEAVLNATDTMTRMVTLRNPMLQSMRNFAVACAMTLPFVRRGVLRNMMEVAIGYPKSPIVSGQGPSPWKDFGAWWSFRSGPKPGERAPDGELVDTKYHAAIRLFDVFRDPRFTVLLFAGRTPNEEAKQRLHSVLEHANSHWSEDIQLCVITPERNHEPRDDVTILVDAGAKLHKKYGASMDCVYVIRPDGYVGYRSMPIDLEHLKNYFARCIFSN